MDKARIKFTIVCPDHERPLTRVDPDPSIQKHAYCVECLMQTQDYKTAYENFPKIPNFLTIAANTFAEQKNQINDNSEVPKEVLDLASTQAESLEKLSKHVNMERRKIETFFNNITNAIIDTLGQLKNEYLEILDKQVANLEEIYTVLDKMLKKFYPKKEDIEMMFPTKEDLESRLENVDSADGLNGFLKDLKQALASTAEDALFRKSSDEFKQSFFEKFSNKLKKIETNKPTFEEKDPNLESAIKDKINKQLIQFLGIEKAFALTNDISTGLGELNYLNLPQSSIIKPYDFMILKEWIPAHHKFSPELLFRMTRDGKDSQTFHSLCDNKGPTITLIKCKYDGTSQMSIIGAFSNKDFDKNDTGFVRSSQAFLFSLNEKEKIKCPILTPEHALHNGSRHEIFFGYNGTISICNGFTTCESHIYPPSSSLMTYANSSKIIPSESLKLNEDIPFVIEELEVYAINNLH